MRKCQTKSKVEEYIVCTRSVKPVAEEISQNFPPQIIYGTKLIFNISVNRRLLLQRWDLSKSIADRKKDTIDLGVLVDEHLHKVD